MSYVRIFAYIKNEAHLIEDWLNHHGSIIPWWGIHVYDNYSDDGTYDILLKYKKKFNINVYRHDTFKQKGDVITEKISTYKNQPGISIPLDGDEFICVWDNNTESVITDCSKIKTELNSLHGVSEIYQTQGWLNCIPERELYTNPVHEMDKFNWSLRDSEMCKKFFDNKMFKSVDLGYHHGTSTNNRRHKSNIVYLHFHDTGRERKRSRCIDIINGHGIPMDTVLQRKESQSMVTGKQFDGVGRVNEYIDIDNWKYEPVGDNYDVKIKPGWCYESS